MKPTEELKRIRLTDIVPSGTNPRKNFNTPDWPEFVANIKAHGVIQPGVARPVNRQDAKNAKVELVCGERRWRASQEAKLPDMPLILRDLTDEQVVELQQIENLQREGLSPLEEAQGYADWRDALIKSGEGKTVEEAVAHICTKINRKRSAVFQRLALLRLHKPIREALVAGTISPSIASAIAVVPLPNLQEKLLKQLETDFKWRAPASVRDVQRIVNDDYCKQLSDAPFKPTDAFQLDEVASPRCTDCPFRSGNLAAEFPELAKRPNICTQPNCFEIKCKSHWFGRAENLREKGKTVLTNSEFNKVKAAYVEADADTRYTVFDGEYDSPAKVLGKHAPEPVLVATADGLKKYFKRDDIAAAAKKAKVKLTSRCTEKMESAEDKSKREAKDKALGESFVRRATLARKLLPELATAAAKMDGKIAWSLLAKEIHLASWDKEKITLFKRVKSNRARVLLDGFWNKIEESLNESSICEPDVFAQWQKLGVNLKAKFEAAEKTRAKQLKDWVKGKTPHDAHPDIQSASLKDKQTKNK